MFRAGIAAAVLVLGASSAGAQITTYVAPPRAAAPSPQMIATADSVRRDSVAQVAMTNMKTWVDSAAGVTVPAYVGDSIAANDPGRPVTTTKFSNGAVAPATATMLPMLAVAGVVVLVAGVALVTTRPRG